MTRTTRVCISYAEARPGDLEVMCDVVISRSDVSVYALRDFADCVFMTTSGQVRVLRLPAAEIAEIALSVEDA